MREEDLDALLRLYLQLDPGNAGTDPEAARHAWLQARASGLVTYLVAEVEGTVVASCFYALIPNLTNGCRPMAFVENVVTDEAFRGRGLASALLRETVARARAAGCYKVFLQSSSRRTGAHRVYAAAGFDGDAKRAFDLRLPGTAAS